MSVLIAILFIEARYGVLVYFENNNRSLKSKHDSE